MRVRVVGEWAHRAADQRDRLVRVAARSGDNPEHVQGVWVVRRLVENAPVELRGAIDPPSPMMGKRRVEVHSEASPLAPNVCGQLSAALASASRSFTPEVKGPPSARLDKSVCTRRR